MGWTVRVSGWLSLLALVAMVGCTSGVSVVGGPADAGVTDMGPPACATGQVRCGGTCVDTATDRANCGACGTACGQAQLCTAGACALSCPTGQSACGTTCANLRTDLQNCGACDRRCAAGQVCSDGACTATCAADLATCAAGGDGGVADGGAAAF
ncbi:MAG: Tryptophan synthase alpha chain, partial [Myxococcaceae bacterium]|nr:Tryptophan synthase alpha chain [Myxococcaceae bacterium]